MQGADNAALLKDLGCIGLVLAAAALALSPLVVVITRRLFPGRNVVFRRWGFSHIAALIVCIAVVLVLATRLFPIAEGENGLVPGLERMACALGAAALMCAWFARKLEPDGIRALGFPAGRQTEAALAGVTCYVLLLPGLVGLMLAWTWILKCIDPSAGAQPALQMALELAPGQRWPAVLLGVLVLPFLEELLFRAFLQPLLVQNLHDRPGIAITALVFALLHGTAASVPIFAFALLLGSLMLRTQRLAAVWSVHALHNALVFTTVFWFPKAVPMLQGHGLLWFF